MAVCAQRGCVPCAPAGQCGWPQLPSAPGEGPAAQLALLVQRGLEDDAAVAGSVGAWGEGGGAHVKQWQRRRRSAPPPLTLAPHFPIAHLIYVMHSCTLRCHSVFLRCHSVFQLPPAQCCSFRVRTEGARSAEREKM